MYKTPGVYVKELPAFAPSIVGVQTAVPAFIGYTAKAEISGKPVYNQAIPIGSLADYIEVFGEDFPPEYKIDEVTDGTKTKNGEFDFKVFDPVEKKEKFYTLTQTTNSEFYLYNSVRLFYANGGGDAFVVSVGNYAAGATISKDALVKGLEVTKEQVGPTMLVIPDAVLLPNEGPTKDPWVSTGFQEVARAMLTQCSELQDRVAILDVYGTQHAKKDNWEAIITQFRLDVGDVALNYGMAYFPFLETSVVAASEFTYENMKPSLADLQKILGWERENLYGPLNPEKPTRADAVQADIDKMADPLADVVKLNQNLTAALPLLVDIENTLALKNNTLPPSGGMAGVYAFVDGTKGVWNAPANIALNSVVQPTFRIDSKQQEDLNVPVDGKAVDAIRDFVGRGPVVWGARTLDGNSNDYRYIQVRRTLIYIEQSIKTALNQFVFAANDGNTWSTVVAMVSSFLQGVWSQGGLMGATASEAFTVQCGLGSTMTGQDILNGYMIVQVTLQMIRPAEFIELTFKQRMEGVS
jgi:phage tail sheath protein FI